MNESEEGVKPLLPPAKPGVWPSRRVLEFKADGSLHTGIGTTSVFRTLDFNGRLIKDTFNGFSRTIGRLVNQWTLDSLLVARLRPALQRTKLDNWI